MNASWLLFCNEDLESLFSLAVGSRIVMCMVSNSIPTYKGHCRTFYLMDCNGETLCLAHLQQKFWHSDDPGGSIVKKSSR